MAKFKFQNTFRFFLESTLMYIIQNKIGDLLYPKDLDLVRGFVEKMQKLTSF